MSGVSWWECSHEGIGLPGCPTCDGRLGDAGRVALREAAAEIERLRLVVADVAGVRESLDGVANRSARILAATGSTSDSAKHREGFRDGLRRAVRALDVVLNGESESCPVDAMTCGYAKACAGEQFAVGWTMRQHAEYVRVGYEALSNQSGGVPDHSRLAGFADAVEGKARVPFGPDYEAGWRDGLVARARAGAMTRAT